MVAPNFKASNGHFCIWAVAGLMERKRAQGSIFSVFLLHLYLCKSHSFPLSLKLLIYKVGVKVTLTAWGSVEDSVTCRSPVCQALNTSKKPCLPRVCVELVEKDRN